MLRRLQKDRHARSGNDRRGEHREDGGAAGRSGRAMAVRAGQSHGQGRHDHVTERAHHVAGQAGQPEAELGDRELRHLEGVIRGVGGNPAGQQEAAMEHVPPLQGDARPVRVHLAGHRDARDEDDERQPAADPRRRPPAAHHRTGPARPCRSPGLAPRRRRPGTGDRIGLTRALLADVHTETLMNTGRMMGTGPLAPCLAGDEPPGATAPRRRLSAVWRSLAPPGAP